MVLLSQTRYLHDLLQNLYATARLLPQRQQNVIIRIGYVMVACDTL
jgi:predicted GNAT family N-acyltransferase